MGGLMVRAACTLANGTLSADRTAPRRCRGCAGSAGGVGILALYLQDRYGWRAGKVQMAVDCCIVLLALWSVEPLRVAWSIAGAVALNLVLAMNHRPGRYMAV